MWSNQQFKYQRHNMPTNRYRSNVRNGGRQNICSFRPQKARNKWQRIVSRKTTTDTKRNIRNQAGTYHDKQPYFPTPPYSPDRVETSSPYGTQCEPVRSQVAARTMSIVLYGSLGNPKSNCPQPDGNFFDSMFASSCEKRASHLTFRAPTWCHLRKLY